MPRQDPRSHESGHPEGAHGRLIESMRLLAYLFDLIVFVVIGRLVALIIQRLFGQPQSPQPGPRSGAAQGQTRPGETARDPVCGMFVSTELSVPLKENGRVLHFCSRECLERYQKEVLHV
jgi:YHS domain-containing protein